MSRDEQIDAILDRHLHTREYDRQRREACKRLGICVVCRSHDAMDSATRCPECEARHQEQKRARYWRDKAGA